MLLPLCHSLGVAVISLSYLRVSPSLIIVSLTSIVSTRGLISDVVFILIRGGD